jgi:hypothetical protein
MHKLLGQVTMSFRVCPKCLRAVPEHSLERYCVNDGTRLLEACPKCETAITNPYGRHCAACGHHLTENTTIRKEDRD